MESAKVSVIDNIDRKIIGLLFEDARKSFSDIGKEIVLSKNAIWTRYQNLCRTGVITGSTVQINYRKLGYEAVGQLLLVVSPSNVDQVINYVKAKIPDVFGPYVSTSRYNVRAVVTLKTLGEFGALKDDLRRKLPVIELQSMLWTDVWFSPQNLTMLPLKKEVQSKNTVTTDGEFCPDEIDLEIIKHLRIDSRLPFRNIGDKLGISPDTISRRYQRLKEGGVIIPRIQINPTKIGYFGVLNYFLRINEGHRIESIIEKVMAIPDLFYLMKCAGDYPMSVILSVKDLNQVIETGVRISKIDGLMLIETSISPILNSWPGSGTYTSTS
jgi:Lrp/AsnC family transcriptional regulator, regulator for asnA, asnC and gidA